MLSFRLYFCSCPRMITTSLLCMRLPTATILGSLQPLTRLNARDLLRLSQQYEYDDTDTLFSAMNDLVRGPLLRPHRRPPLRRRAHAGPSIPHAGLILLVGAILLHRRIAAPHIDPARLEARGGPIRARPRRSLRAPACPSRARHSVQPAAPCRRPLRGDEAAAAA
jgi:hypothetical protein